MRNIIFQFMLALLPLVTAAQPSKKGFGFVDHASGKQVDVFYNGKLLTAYCHYDSSRKPFLFPVNTVDGVTVTRGYPFAPVAGERTDHPHHTGIWLNYESVNGLDFWNNSTAIAPEKRVRYGTIVHQQVLAKSIKEAEASLAVAAIWIRPDRKVLLDENTVYTFRVKDNSFIIDRVTTLTARDTTVIFKDVKDGMFAIRVARELELPSKEPSAYIDDKGNVTQVPASGTEVTGMYYGSTGAKGDSLWSTKGPWAMLTGKKEGKDITVGIFDHPSNVGYPAYWHARGYGLFSLNPLGRKIFSQGKEELNFSLAPGASTTFRYRVIIHSGPALSSNTMNAISKDFEQVK